MSLLSNIVRLFLNCIGSNEASKIRLLKYDTFQWFLESSEFKIPPQYNFMCRQSLYMCDLILISFFSFEDEKIYHNDLMNDAVRILFLVIFEVFQKICSEGNLEMFPFSPKFHFLLIFNDSQKCQIDTWRWDSWICSQGF